MCILLMNDDLVHIIKNYFIMREKKSCNHGNEGQNGIYGMCGSETNRKTDNKFLIIVSKK